MAADALEKFARSIEAAFYKKDVATFCAALAAEEAEAAGALGRATGIDDPYLLARLAELGIRPETLAALTLIPLIETAWADGVMARERARRGAARRGHERHRARERELPAARALDDRAARARDRGGLARVHRGDRGIAQRARARCAAREGDRPRVGGRERGGRLPRCDAQRLGRRARRARRARCPRSARPTVRRRPIARDRGAQGEIGACAC